MKKNTMKSLVAYLNGETVTNIAEIKAELEAELAKGEEKAQANRELYATAHDVVLAHIGSEPLTVADIYDACADELPEGFSKSKIQYAVRELWGAELVKHENGKNPFTYTRA